MEILKNAIDALTVPLTGAQPLADEKPSLDGGRLRPCPWTPNCVCSEDAGPLHHVEPLAFSGPAERAWALLKEVIAREGGAVQDEQPGYIWSTFPIPVFGYIDDVEFRLAADEGVIHVRSSARLGFYDLNVNRTRVEQLRTALRNSLEG